MSDKPKKACMLLKTARAAENSRNLLILLAFIAVLSANSGWSANVLVTEENPHGPEHAAATSRLREAVRRAGGNELVSQRSGVALRTLSAYLSGGEVKMSNLVRLSRATGASVEWLATGGGVLPPWMRRLAEISDEKQHPLTPPARHTVDVHWLTKAIEIVEALGGDRLPAKERAIRIARSYEMLMAPSDDAPPLPKLPLRGA